MGEGRRGEWGRNELTGGIIPSHTSAPPVADISQYSVLRRCAVRIISSILAASDVGLYHRDH